MNSEKNNKIIIVDTSAILSGKELNFKDAIILTTQSVSDELKPGGKDYLKFQFLKEKGLTINIPSDESVNRIKKISEQTGDIFRLSKTDIDILALALDNQKISKNTIIITDDYSIQNVADHINIKYFNISQFGIKKRFKWVFRCRGCGKKFNQKVDECPICGYKTKNVISHKHDLKKNGRSDEQR